MSLLGAPPGVPAAARCPVTFDPHSREDRPRPYWDPSWPMSADFIAMRRCVDRPSCAGPGEWNTIHRFARRLRACEYAGFVRALLDAVGCSTCREHGTAYVAEHPPPLDGDAQALFDWSFEWHNAANAELGKPTITWDEATALHANG